MPNKLPQNPGLVSDDLGIGQDTLPAPAITDSHVLEVADLLHERLGSKGGVVCIDGQSGVGKTTLCQQIGEYFELRRQPQNAVALPLDEHMLLRGVTTVLKRRVLGQDTDQDKAILDREGWADVVPGEPYDRDYSMWQHDIIKWELDRIVEFLGEAGHNGQSTAFTLTNEQARINVGNIQLRQSIGRTIRLGDAVLVDGKYANLPFYGSVADIRIRVESDPDTVRRQFRKKRQQLMLGEKALEEDMRYFDLVVEPSWASYSKQTQEDIDITVDPSSSNVTVM